MKRTVITALGTGAIVAGSAVPFTVKSGDFKGGTKPTLVVTNMAAGETATLLKNGQIVKDGVLAFDSSECCVTLESPGEYSIYKDITVGDPAVIIENSI
jgi:hypothetical protein